MSYGFRSHRTHPDKNHSPFTGKHKNRVVVGSNGGAVIQGWVSLIQDNEGFTGEVSIIGDPLNQGKYVGNGRSFLFYQSRPFNWVIPVEVKTPLETEMGNRYGKRRMMPRPEQVLLGAPYVLKGEDLYLPSLSLKEQTVFDKIVNSVREGMSNLILRRVDTKNDNIEARFSPEFQELMQPGYLCGQVEIKF